MAAKKPKHADSPVKEYLKAAACVVLCLAAGAIGGLFTKTGPGSWYEEIAKPSFNPPGWVFGPVWTFLYILMGISFYIALRNGADKKAKVLFGIQLLLNTLWSMIFFGLHSPFLALVEIYALWLMIAWCMYEFFKVSRTAAYLLVPYLLWVSFASILNFSIYLLN